MSPSSIDTAADGTVVVSGHVEILGLPDAGALGRSAHPAPEVEGSLVASDGDDMLGHAAVDPATGTAELRLSGLRAGTGTLRLAFVPDTFALASDDAEVAFTVRPAPAAELADTGATGAEAPAALGAALALILGAGLLVARRIRTGTGDQITA